MKIIGWISILFFGSIVLRVLLILGYKVVMHEAFVPADAVMVLLGLIAIWILRTNIRTFISRAKTNSQGKNDL